MTNYRWEVFVKKDPQLTWGVKIGEVVAKTKREAIELAENSSEIDDVIMQVQFELGSEYYYVKLEREGMTDVKAGTIIPERSVVSE